MVQCEVQTKVLGASAEVTCPRYENCMGRRSGAIPATVPAGAAPQLEQTIRDVCNSLQPPQAPLKRRGRGRPRKNPL